MDYWTQWIIPKVKELEAKGMSRDEAIKTFVSTNQFNYLTTELNIIIGQGIEEIEDLKDEVNAIYNNREDY